MFHIEFQTLGSVMVRNLIKMWATHIFLALCLAFSTNGKYIVPGGRWQDTDGNSINAHGGGITFDQDSGRFWWFGEYKTEEQPEGGGVSAYSSDDLGTWKWEGLALSMFIFTIFNFFLLLASWDTGSCKIIQLQLRVIHTSPPRT